MSLTDHVEAIIRGERYGKTTSRAMAEKIMREVAVAIHIERDAPTHFAGETRPAKAPVGTYYAGTVHARNIVLDGRNL